MTRDDLRALEAEIDLCNDVHLLENIHKRIPRWRRRAKKKSHELLSHFDSIKAKLEVKIYGLHHRWDMFELGAVPAPAVGSTVVLPKAVKKLHRMVVDSMSGELVFYGEPVDE